ncbi:MAG: flagellar export protein FliJ [Lachnospiraceae bacterium]|nr:flagellar export protein FliJ [Lachnospiraceae bacterium]
MAKFVYRMQNILDIKEKLENQAAIAYSQANQRLQEENNKLMQLLSRKNSYEKQARELVQNQIDVVEIQHCRKAIESMKVLIRRQMLEVQVAEKNAEAARRHLAELMKDRKTHEKLKENAFEEFKRELNAEDNKLVDELVSYTYGKEK